MLSTARLIQALGDELAKAKASGIEKETAGDNQEDASSRPKRILNDEAVTQLQVWCDRAPFYWLFSC